MSEVADVVIVGGGVAGGAAAAVLTTRGLDVVVLERQHAFRDCVRGERPRGVSSRCAPLAWRTF